MTRQEFLAQLREALQGAVSPSVMNENLNYYENYILQEVRKGRTEEEVLDELGNPRILAQTIIDTAGVNGNRTESSYSYKEDYSGRGYQENANREYGRVITGTKAKLILWATIIAVILVIIGIICLIAGVISVIAPVLIPLLLIMLAIRIIGKK